MKICKHLKMILDHESDKGNIVERIDEKKWTNAEYVVKVKNVLDTGFVSANIVLSGSVEYWENNDTHYDFKKGYFCKECKHGIISP